MNRALPAGGMGGAKGAPARGEPGRPLAAHHGGDRERQNIEMVYFSYSKYSFC